MSKVVETQLELMLDPEVGEVDGLSQSEALTLAEIMISKGFPVKVYIDTRLPYDAMGVRETMWTVAACGLGEQ